MHRCLGFFVIGWTILLGSQASGAEFEPGNLLTATGGVLREYTQDGVQAQAWAIPHPTTTRFDATDVVVDPLGRAHVLVIAPFDTDFIATFDPVTAEWDLIQIEAFLGNGSDGDLAIFGDYLFTKSRRINWVTGEIADFPSSGGEVNVGLDGLVYSINSGSPRYRVRVFDPISLQELRVFELRDDQGFRLNGRGIAVNASGDRVYVADWDGRFYVFDGEGNWISTHLSGTESLNDIDLTPGGQIASGQRFGDAVLTDLTFENPVVLPIGAEYIAFVPDETERVDEDQDQVLDLFDNCPDVANADQLDRDEDGLGDACDPYPGDPDNLGACLGDLTSAERLAASQSETIGTLMVEVDRLNEELASCQAPDVDGDGVIDDLDRCPLSQGGAVDQSGCTLPQFCSGYSGSGWRSVISCVSADWNGNEAGKRKNRRARDCRPVWARPGVKCRPAR